MFLCYSLGLLEIKMVSFWGLKLINENNKRPPLALENLISAPGAYSKIYGKYIKK